MSVDIIQKFLGHISAITLLDVFDIAFDAEVASEAEVAELELAVEGQQNVFRFDVKMNDRILVDFLECLADVFDNLAEEGFGEEFIGVVVAAVEQVLFA